MKTRLPGSQTACLLSLFIGASCWSQVFAAEIICEQRFHAIMDGHELPIAFCSTHELDQDDLQVTRLILVAHPSGEKSFASVQKMIAAATVAGETDTTLIVSPQFPLAEDLLKNNLEQEVLFWNSLWRGGAQNDDFTPPIWPARISSYAVMDQMIASICTSGHFANIETVVVTGMSAGGQVADRYAKISRIEEEVLDTLGIEIHYVVFAPSSFGYLDERRAVDGTTDVFEKPDPTMCSTYDTWKYGLTGIYPVLPFSSRADTTARFETRNVVYACGTADNDPQHSSLDVSCPAMFQGAHRLERTLTHLAHLMDIYGGSAECTKKLVLIPDINHWEVGLFGAEEVRGYLFGSFGSSAVDDHVVTGVGQSVVVFPLSNDTNGPCETITLASWESQSAQAGTITSCGATCLLYAPPSGFTGTDSFEYTIASDSGEYSSASVEVDVVGAPSIQPMIDAASNGQVILVPPGTYFEAIDFKGKAIELRSEKGAEQTIIDNLQRGTVVTMTSGEQASSILDGFTIRGGLEDEGGGLNVQNGSPTIRNCIFRDNSARRGAGVRLLGSNSRVVNCTFFSNVAWEDGGGMRVSGGGAPVIDSCTFLRNTALDDGGGFAAWSCSPTLQGCQLEGNRTGDRGGAVRLGETNILIWGCTIVENIAGREGAGVYGYSSTTGTISNCQIQRNMAEEGGGLFSEDDGTMLMVEQTLLCGNRSNQIMGPWSEGARVIVTDECPNTCPADLNGNGSVDGADLTIVLGDWGLTDSPGDLNDDGLVDGADLTIVLAAWGACP